MGSFWARLGWTIWSYVLRYVAWFFLGLAIHNRLVPDLLGSKLGLTEQHATAVACLGLLVVMLVDMFLLYQLLSNLGQGVTFVAEAFIEFVITMFLASMIEKLLQVVDDVVNPVVLV